MAACQNNVEANPIDVVIKGLVSGPGNKEIITNEGVLCSVTADGHDEVMAVPRANLVELGWLEEECSPKTTTQATSAKLPSDTEWGPEDTKLLLDNNQEYLSNVGPFKKFRNKKTMWAQISADVLQSLGINRTPLQCENRYKTVLKRKQKVCANNNTSGSTRQPVEFEDEINKIKSIDDSVEPEVLRGVGRVELAQKRKATSGSAGPSTSSQKVRTTSHDALMAFLHEQEMAKERRHQEKLELLKSIFGEKEPTN